MNFKEWLNENLNKKDVPVFDKDGNVIGYVYKSTTSIGAAKVAGTKSARFTKKNGVYGWIGFEDLKK